MRIKELEELSRVPRTTIHFYLRQGILHPPHKTGRTMAYYDDSHIQRLKEISQLKKGSRVPIVFLKEHIKSLDVGTAAVSETYDVTKTVVTTKEKEQKRQEIIKAAIRVFSQKGYHQTKIVDITRSHLDTLQFLFPQAQRMASTPDTIQGMPLPSKRTLGEVEQVNQSANLRLGQDAAMIDKQLVGPTARRLVANRQQFSSMDVTVRLAGRLIQQMEKATGKKVEVMSISPADLGGNFDYIPHTPSMAPDPARQTAIWGQLLQLLGSAPQLLNPDPTTGMAIDPLAVFEEFVRSAGVNYFDRFMKEIPPMPGQAPPGMMPPEAPAAGGIAPPSGPGQTEKAVQSGTMVP
jgi:DNA-binding transcriptional MerR regulator